MQLARPGCLAGIRSSRDDRDARTPGPGGPVGGSRLRSSGRACGRSWPGMPAGVKLRGRHGCWQKGIFCYLGWLCVHKQDLETHKFGLIFGDSLSNFVACTKRILKNGFQRMDHFFTTKHVHFLLFHQISY